MPSPLSNLTTRRITTTSLIVALALFCSRVSAQTEAVQAEVDSSASTEEIPEELYQSLNIAGIVAVDHPELTPILDMLNPGGNYRLDQAEQLCTRFLESEPTGDVYLLRAAIRIDQKRAEDAHLDIDAAVANGHSDWMVHWIRSMAFRQQGLAEEAAAQDRLMNEAIEAEGLMDDSFLEDLVDLADFDPVPLLENNLIESLFSRPLYIVIFTATVFCVLFAIGFSRGRRQRRDGGGSWSRLVAIATFIAALWTCPVITLGAMSQSGLGQMPSLFWLVFSALLIAALVWSMMSPPNFTYVGKEPLPLCEDPDLLDRIRRLAEGMHVRVPRVRVQASLNALKDGAAAFVGGLAPYSIVVYDTVLQQLREDEQDAVIGHELSHIANRSILVYVTIFPLAVCGGVAAAFFSDGYFGLVTALALRLGLHRAASRWFEYDCDRRAGLATTPDAMARGLRRIYAGHALGKPTLASALAHSTSTHPSLDERVAALSAMDAEEDSVTVPFSIERVRLCRLLTRFFALCWLLIVPGAIGYTVLVGETWLTIHGLHLVIVTPMVVLLVALRRPARIASRRIHGRFRWSKLTLRHFIALAAGCVLAVSVVFLFLLDRGHMPENNGPADFDGMDQMIWLANVLSVLVIVVALTARRNGNKLQKLKVEITAAFQRNDYDGVLQIAADNYPLTESDKLLRHNAAVALLATGRREKAIELLEKLHHDFPLFAVTATSLASVYLDEGRFEESLEMIDRILPELDPCDHLLHTEACRAWRALGHADEAQAACERAATVVSDDTTVHALLAVLALDRSDRAEADRQIALGESLLPADPFLRMARGERAAVDGDMAALEEELTGLRQTVSEQPLLLINRPVRELESKLAELKTHEQSANTGADADS